MIGINHAYILKLRNGLQVQFLKQVLNMEDAEKGIQGMPYAEHHFL